MDYHAVIEVNDWLSGVGVATSFRGREVDKLADRYPGIRRLQPVPGEGEGAEDYYPIVQPYLKWQLAEIDTVTSDILIRRPSEKGEAAQMDDLLILVGPIAAAWLRARGEAQR